MKQDELMHYGVPGMRWGHRKALPISSQRARYDAAKQQYKADKKVYRKNSTQLNKSKSAMKKAKKDRKQSMKSAYYDIKKSESIKEKLIYGDSSRNKAAKYVVDNNMSISDAKKKANKEAIRNSAIILGTYGAIKVASLYMNNRG